MNAIQNFEEIAKQLIESAPTPKALAFAEKNISAVRAKGGAWIEANAQDLRVTFVPGDLFPVADNRGFYIAAMQMTLLNK